MHRIHDAVPRDVMTARARGPGALWWTTAVAAVAGAAIVGAWAGRRLELMALRERAEAIGRVLAALERDASETDRGERLPPTSGDGTP